MYLIDTAHGMGMVVLLDVVHRYRIMICCDSASSDSISFFCLQQSRQQECG